ncbi:MAG: excinuclease ABC subunit C, partial [Chloroflexi bacterium]|nr:excinuclease ABC subunit C [Chloroflexota bacterium]
EQAGAAEVPTASIAKEKEEVFIPDVAGPLPLAATSPGLHLLQRIRDEAHRFAVTYHRKVRGEASRVSVLDSIPGIGPKRRRALLRQFGSLASVKEASQAQLAATSTMTRTLAERVKRYLDSYGD